MDQIPLANLNGHQARMFSDFPVIFSYRGNALTGTRSSPDLSQQLELGGPEFKTVTNLFASSTVLGVVPEIGELIIMDGKTWKIMDVKLSPDAGQMVNMTMGWGRLD
jgi:hypothetical protein